MALQKVSKSDFQSEVIDSEELVVVDFYADWCGPCKRMLPDLEAVAGEYSGKAKVVKLNVDEDPEIGAQYGVQGIPNLTFFRGGKPVDVSLGAIPKQLIQKKIEQNLAVKV